MDRLSGQIIRHRKGVVITTVIIALICCVLQFFVIVNYNIIDYLPENVQSTKGITVMDESFDVSTPNARVMIENVSMEEALQYKNEIRAIKGVNDVMWLDDIVDINIPLEMSDEEFVKQYYKDRNALFDVEIENGHVTEATEAIYDLIGDKGYMSGETAESAYAMDLSSSETRNAMFIAIPLIIIILLLSTSSWIEPLLFLIAIGIAVIINMATNLFTGEVSFITQTITPILQLAVTLDYSIFLLHRFELHRQNGEEPDVAMRHAIKKAFPTIGASAATTFFGFFALTFMDFGIGANLGLSLMKGILFSFLSVIIFFPALILCSYKLIDRTKHRNLMPAFKSIPGIVNKAKIPCIILVLIIVFPSFLAQSENDFKFGTSNISEGSKVAYDTEKINEVFSEDNRIVVIVPRGEPVKEKALADELLDLPNVTDVMSYAKTVGTEIPSDFLTKETINQFYSDEYARIIIYTDLQSEGAEAFKTVKKIRDITGSYYDTSYQVGRSPSVYDMKEVITSDNAIVNAVAIIAIGLVILITFRSLSMPIILVLTIEASIWINLAIPYFTGSGLNYIGYLIISTVQLGATVDYAILLSHRYLEKRKTFMPKRAVREALGETFGSILISASILTIAGLGLAYTSTNPMVSEMGILLARGTMLSFVMVIFFLSPMLAIIDKAIGKTTYKSNFLRKSEVGYDSA